MQISFCFCKTCTCLKILENIQISVNVIDRLDINDEYSVKCDFILNTVIFINAALNISLRKVWKCNVLWFYLLGQRVPNETKGMINLNTIIPPTTKQSDLGLEENNGTSSWENLFLPYANNKGADQPTHPCSLISTFVVQCLDSIISLVSISEISSL